MNIFYKKCNKLYFQNQEGFSLVEDVFFAAFIVFFCFPINFFNSPILPISNVNGMLLIQQNDGTARQFFLCPNASDFLNRNLGQ